MKLWNGGNMCRIKKIKIFQYLKNPQLFLLKLDQKGIIRMKDEKYIKALFKQEIGVDLNLEDPKTFNEKLQWLKLYNRDPRYTKMVDKFEVKKYIKKNIGEQYVIPTIGVYEKFSDINFDKLPDKFVIKCTHDSGTIIICKNKKDFDLPSARLKINKALRKNFYYQSREWPYKNVKPRIIIEPYIEDSDDKELRDYKFYCFGGKPHVLLLATDRLSGKGLCFDYFDMNFKHLALTNHWHPNAAVTPHKPKHFELMKRLASQLSNGIPHVRVDFYEANGNVYVGELTFFDMGGQLKIHPDNWEKEWGDLITLPGKRNSDA